jgi:3-hydroxybutyryl-CoA dehydratase
MDLLFTRPLDALEPGERFRTRGRTVTEADVVAFASLTGDFHPQHVDAQWAGDGPFGERIAHGMLVLSFAAGLVPFDPDRVVALRRVREVVFKRPVHLGDTVHVEGKITAVEPLDERTGLVTVAWTVTNQHARTVARASVEVLWRRDAVAATGAQPEWDDAPPVEASGLVHAFSSVPL